MIIRQSDLARELGASDMTIHRVLRAFDRNGRPLSEHDCLLVMAVAELRDLGFTTSTATDLLEEFPREVRYVGADQARKCWISFIETGSASFRVASLSERHLAAILDAMGKALVIPLHELVARAGERVAALKSRLVADKEAA